MTTDSAADSTPQSEQLPPKPLPYRQRRILGVLMEKARTTPDAYPLSLNGLVSGCNQKSNRHPVMDLTAEQIEDELEKMRAAGPVRTWYPLLSSPELDQVRKLDMDEVRRGARPYDADEGGQTLQ